MSVLALEVFGRTSVAIGFISFDVASYGFPGFGL